MRISEKNWTATEFERIQGKFQINGEISNMPRDKNPDFYQDVCDIFNEEMYACFNEVRDISKFDKLNVVIRAHSYQLKENQTFEGQFHHEGLNVMECS